MYAILSLVVCLTTTSVPVCETVLPELTHADGRPLTFFECLTANGQSIARQWVAEHPQYRLQRIQCSIANDAEQLRATIEQPEA